MRLALVATLCLAGLSPAKADPPSSGKLVRAFASWRLPTKSEKRWRTIQVAIQRHETPDGNIRTKASVSKFRCHRDGSFSICESYLSGKIRKASLDHDELLTKATARLVMTSGEIMKASWAADDPLPDGMWTSDQTCGAASGKAAGLTKPATARGTVFGIRLRRSVPDETGLTLGFESTDCS